MSIIIPKLHLFQVQRKLLLGDAMKLNNPLLGITPKPLQTINIHSPRRKMPLMVNPQMPITTKHQGIITSKLIRINDGSTPDLLDGHVEQRLRRNVLDHLDSNRPIALVNAENRDFSGCPSAPLAFPSASKVSLIELNLPFKKPFLRLAGHNRHTKHRDGSKNGGITESNLLGDLSGRELHFKELNNPEPLLVRDPKLLNPSIREIVKAIFAPLTAVLFSPDAIDFSAFTACTKNRSFFPTRFFEKKSCPVFRFSNEFKGFQFH